MQLNLFEYLPKTSIFEKRTLETVEMLGLYSKTAIQNERCLYW